MDLNPGYGHAEFNTEIVVGNVSLQLCGIEPTDVARGYSNTDVQRNAAALQVCYGKPRQAIGAGRLSC